MRSVARSAPLSGLLNSSIAHLSPYSNLDLASVMDVGLLWVFWWVQGSVGWVLLEFRMTPPALRSVTPAKHVSSGRLPTVSTWRYTVLF